MNKAEEVSDKIKKLPLPELLRMAATALDNTMPKAQLEFVLIHLEIALQKRRMIINMGIEE